MKLRLWMCFGDSPNFCKDDRTMFYVIPADGNREHKITHESFIEAETYEDARDEMIDAIKKWYAHRIHMRDLPAAALAVDRKRKDDIRAANESLKGQSSLSIGGEDPASPKPSSKQLLVDLMDLAEDGGNGQGKPAVS